MFLGENPVANLLQCDVGGKLNQAAIQRPAGGQVAEPEGEPRGERDRDQDGFGVGVRMPGDPPEIASPGLAKNGRPGIQLQRVAATVTSPCRKDEARDRPGIVHQRENARGLFAEDQARRGLRAMLPICLSDQPEGPVPSGSRN